jgi:N-acetylmuramoyl-L-alanine amidase
MVAALASGALAHLTGIKICIDPGHGGSDPGAVSAGYYEKTINLAIGNNMNSRFVADNASTKRTRSTDIYVSLQGRCDIANNWGASRFESTHCNAFSLSSANGTETFCCPGCSSNSYTLRNRVNPELVSHMGTVNRGVKTASFTVLTNTTMPAILGEVAFITNSADRAKLINSTYQWAAATAYLHGTQSAYGVTPHTH